MYTAAISSSVQWEMILCAHHVRTQLSAGADINKQDGDGNTALIHAAMEKSHGVCDYLISKGADVNIRNNGVGDYLDAFNSDDY